MPAERGIGIASEAVRALVRWLHDRLGVTTVTAEIDDANSASVRVAVASGFERTIRRAGDEVVWEHRTTVTDLGGVLLCRPDRTVEKHTPCDPA